MNDYFEKYGKVTIGALVLLIISGVILFAIAVDEQSTAISDIISSELAKIDIGTDVPETNYVPSQDYFDYYSTATAPVDYGTYTVFSAEDSSAVFEEDKSGASFIDEKPKAVISDANKALYDLADKYFTCYYGSMRVSPILPLAQANVETGGRADNTKTWSSLFPSRIVPIEYLYSMDVTTVISDPSIYKALSTEYSTRDRGALQMSPTYGTGDSYFNSMMSGNEVDKLKAVDTSTYSAWCQGASPHSGDRFYVPDVCLRLSAAYNGAINFMLENNYEPKSDFQLVAMLAMHHHQSAVWCKADHSQAVGKWKSGELAYKYAALVSSQEFADALSAHAKSNPNKYFIDANVAKSIFKSVTGDDMNNYATNTMVCTYPIKVLYAYIKLCSLYSM